MKGLHYIVSLIYCLFCYAVEGAGLPDPDHEMLDHVQVLEKHILHSCGRNVEERKELSDKLVQAVMKKKGVKASGTVDWAGATLGDMVSNLVSIQRIKLNNRSSKPGGSTYVTKYSSTGGDDPYPITMEFAGSAVQNLKLNYNGSSYTHQPGNCFLKEVGGAALTYDNGTTFDDFIKPPSQLLMATEIARRKAVDPYRHDGVDEHANVPVAVGIMMATKLAKKCHIDINSFWKKTGKYHIFTGTNNARMAGFSSLLEKYKEFYKFLPSVTEDHAAEVFGFPPE